MPGWQHGWLVIAILLTAGMARAERLRPSWECLPDDTVLMARLPDASGFVEEVRSRTKFGGFLLRPDRLESLWEFFRRRINETGRPWPIARR